MVAVHRLVVSARYGCGRRAGSRTVTGGKHAMPARYAANRRARTEGAPGARRAMSAMRERTFRVIRPAPIPKLGGAMIAPDIPTWQVMIRAAQTPAFGIAVIVSLVFSGLSAAALPSLAPRPTPHPAQRPTPHLGHGLPLRDPATTALKLGSSTYPAPPLGDTRGENAAGLGPGPTPKVHDEAHPANPYLGRPQDIPNREAPTDNPDLEAALTELDQQADRDQAWSAQHLTPPGPAPSCPPICADPNAPKAQSELNPPPAPPRVGHPTESGG